MMRDSVAGGELQRMASQTADSTRLSARRPRVLLALRTVFACVAFLFMGMASTLQAATVTATWNPNPESNIAGYKLSYGTQSGVYTNVVDVGNVTSWPVTLAGPQRYYFAVQAYNTSSLLSPYSTEIIFDAPAPPALTSLSPAIGPVGTSVTITGTNFGATQGTSTVKFNGITCDADELVGHEHRRAGAGGSVDGERHRHGQWRCEQCAAVYGRRAADPDLAHAGERTGGDVGHDCRDRISERRKGPAPSRLTGRRRLRRRGRRRASWCRCRRARRRATWW